MWSKLKRDSLLYKFIGITKLRLVVTRLAILDGLTLRSPKAWRLSSAGSSPTWVWPSLRCIAFPSMRLFSGVCLVIHLLALLHFTCIENETAYYEGA